MIYNFNLGIGWASSGVEYAQSYRAKVLRRIGAVAKFIFTDMFPRENIEHMTANIGFLDEEVIWLYTFFTDQKIEPVSYTLKDVEDTIEGINFKFERDGNMAKFIFDQTNTYYRVYMVNDTDDRVHRIEIVSRGCLIRKDYFTSCKIYSEYYAPLDNAAHLYERRFFNRDGSVAYEEIIDGTDKDEKQVVYRFPDAVLYSKPELVGYMVRKLNLTKDDIVIIDRSTMLAQPILENVGPARVGIIVHADHFSEGSTTDEYVLWNNYYEYDFSNYRFIDFFVTATDEQNKLMREQFKKYLGAEPNVVTVPVGALKELKHPDSPRRKHALITASRLATEKHIDWVVDAVVKARETVPDITLDIYGEGGEKEKLTKLIEKNNAGDYIKLMGQQNLEQVYIKYDAYIAGSTSEGFGLTLLEAIGSGLPIIGYNVRYGNPTFIDHEKNGYLIPNEKNMKREKRVSTLTDCIIKLFTEADMEAFHEHSYEKAEKFLEKEVEKQWQSVFS